MDTARTQPRRRNGFTMIEVMIVVILLAITAAIAMPMVGNRADLKLAAASRATIADLQYAQNYAIATRESIYVRFEQNKYTVCKKSGVSLVPLTQPIDRTTYVVKFNSSSAPSALRDVSLGIPTFNGEIVLGFDSLGAPFAYNEATAAKSTFTTRGTLTLSCGGQQQLIYVEPYTGELSVP